MLLGNISSLITTEVMKSSERVYIDSLSKYDDYHLMLRAGIGLSQYAANYLLSSGGKRVAVISGGGNNGGDGYVSAIQLAEYGYDVTVYGDAAKTPDCIYYRHKCEEAGIDIQPLSDVSELSEYDLAIDCLIGVGLNGNVRDNYARIIDLINTAHYIISCDIPSGLHSDNGLADSHCVRADETVTMHLPKAGLCLNDGLDMCGLIHTVDLGLHTAGLEIEVVTENDIRSAFPKKRRNSHKGTYGIAGIVACSKKAVGAGMFAVNSLEAVSNGMDGVALANIVAECAMRSGSGLCRLFVPADILPEMLYRVTNATVGVYADFNDSKVSAVAYGMGVGLDNNMLDSVLAKGVPTVIDADGLNILSIGDNLSKIRGREDIVLTPHPLEFARLLRCSVSEILANPIGLSQAFAKKYGVTVLLKGASTVITDGERVAINIRGSAAMAKGGSGDILSGVLASLLARGLSVYDSAKISSFLCGVAGEKLAEKYGEYAACASDIPEILRDIVAYYSKNTAKPD